MEIVDIIIAVLLVIGLIEGIKDGLVKQVAGLVGLVAGLLIGKALYLKVADQLTPFLGTSEKTTQIIAFALIMVIVPLAFSLIAWLISKLLHSVGLGWVNRLLGAAVGAVKYALIAGLIITGIESFDSHGLLISQEKKDSSIFYYPLYNTTGILIKDVKEQIEVWKETHGEDADVNAAEPECEDEQPTSAEPDPSSDLQSFEEAA